MDPYPAPDFVVPGMRVGCLPYDALADSTLECFFSETCLNDTERWISSLPVASRPKPLNSSAMSHFLPRTPFNTILAMAMIDHWKNATNYSGYYHACEPIQCTYTTVKRNGFIYLIVLLIGLYGGLTVALRIISPWAARGRHFFLCQFQKRSRSSLQTQTGLRVRIKRMLHRAQERILSLNLFNVSWHFLMIQRIS